MISRLWNSLIILLKSFCFVSIVFLKKGLWVFYFKKLLHLKVHFQAFKLLINLTALSQRSCHSSHAKCSFVCSLRNEHCLLWQDQKVFLWSQCLFYCFDFTSPLPPNANIVLECYLYLVLFVSSRNYTWKKQGQKSICFKSN